MTDTQANASRNLSLSIIAFAAFSAICYFGATVMVTIVMAILTAYLLDPVVNAFQRIRIPRSISIFISLLITAVLITAIILLFVDRAQKFSDNLPRYRSKIQRVRTVISQRFLAFEKKQEDFSKTILPKTTRDEPKPILVQQYSGWSDFFLRGAGHYLIQISFFPFLVYFLLIEKDSIRMFVTNMIRGESLSLTTSLVETAAAKVVNDVNNKIRGFVVGYLVSTLILFLLAWVVFMLFKVEEALIWAIIFALMNILPFLGALFSVIPPLIIGIIQLSSVEQSIALIAICVGIHLLYANYLIPRTTGKRTALSPLVVMLAMMYWGFLWGAIGILLAIPITASLRSIWLQYRALPLLDQRRKSIIDQSEPQPEVALINPEH
jgi:predicted PurR-regulated permease PerM